MAAKSTSITIRARLSANLAAQSTELDASLVIKTIARKPKLGIILMAEVTRLPVEEPLQIAQVVQTQQCVCTAALDM